MQKGLYELNNNLLIIKKVRNWHLFLVKNSNRRPEADRRGSAKRCGGNLFPRPPMGVQGEGEEQRCVSSACSTKTHFYAFLRHVVSI